MVASPRAFFLFGDGGLHVEATIAQAAAYMEPADVQSGEWGRGIFDDLGRRYDVAVVARSTRIESTSVIDLEGLRARLREDPSRDLVGFDAEDPLGAAVAIARWEWEHRWPMWPRWLSRRLHGVRPRITE